MHNNKHFEENNTYIHKLSLETLAKMMIKTKENAHMFKSSNHLYTVITINATILTLLSQELT